MRVIILTQGQHTVVDDDVYEWASKFKWYARKARTGRGYYAVRNVRLSSGRRVTCWLHREIMKADPSVEVDHRDRDGLNNLGDNLRTCSRSENNRNCSMRQGGTSKYKGVSWHKKNCNWVARITASHHTIPLGSFESEIDAAREYDRAALELFGEFAKINFPQ